MNNISFVVCTKNAIDTIESCLNSIKKYTVILVDKDSTDGTLEVAKQFDNVTIVKQKGNGLADAHNIGVSKVKTKYVCIFGSDNVLSFGKGLLELNNGYKLEDIIKYMNKNNWIGVSFLTYIKYFDMENKYYSKCLNKWWVKKFTAGEREVIGTPCIYEAKILKKFKYDTDCQFCDDSDLGERLKEAGYKQGYSPYYVYDISNNNLKEIVRRFGMYGKSDAQYYKKYSKVWGLKRKIKSLLHPFSSEWIGFNIFYLPFYLLIVSIRCFYYYKEIMK